MKISVIWEENSKITVSVPDSVAYVIFNDLTSKALIESTRAITNAKNNSKRVAMNNLEEKIIKRRDI